MMIGQRNPAFDLPPLNTGPLGPPIVAAPAPPAPQRQKGSWAGILADALFGAMGRPGPYAQHLERQQRDQSEFERGEQQYQRQRADSRDDFLWKQQNDIPSPYRWESNDGSLNELAPDGTVRQIYKDPTPKMQAVQGFDEQGNPVIRFIAPPGQGGPPAAPVGKLRPIGGSTPPASSGFR